jgi:hypothetical protein
MEQAFPQRQDLIVAVLDAPTAEGADAAAEALAEILRARGRQFRSVRRPDAGAFWRRHALLYLDTAELREVTARLIEAQPLLAAIAADPSLRGVADLLRLMEEGVARGDASPSAWPLCAKPCKPPPMPRWPAASPHPTGPG